MNPEDKDPQDENPNGEPGPRPDGEESPAEAPRPSAGESSATYYDDPYHDESDYERDDPYAAGEQPAQKSEKPAGDSQSATADPPPPPKPPAEADEDDEEEGMARMSFMDHLGELRTRILRSLGGLLVVYLLCLTFAKDLLQFVLVPFYAATESMRGPTGEALRIVNIRPLEQFQVIYIKVPLIAAVFLAAPWLMYQAWRFIAPGLYKRERRWAVPFIFSTAALFIMGGAFCYFVALRVTLQFLLTIGIDQIEPYISVSEYLDTFIILELGLALVFQLPVLIFFFTLMRLTTPRFLLRNVRYAILIMFVIAAIITPTGDPFTMTLFAGPMILLYFIGIGASWLLTLKREGQAVPWFRIVLAVLTFFGVIGGIVYYMYANMGYRFVADFPWFVGP